MRFPDGAWWVELAPLADERLVGAAIAAALGVRPLPGVTELQAAGAYLASRRALVVLDNCEHLAGGMRGGRPRRSFRPRPSSWSWPRAGRRSGSPGRPSGGCRRCRCPGFGDGERRRPCRVGRGRRRLRRRGAVHRAGGRRPPGARAERQQTPTRWRRSAPSSTACRWRSSSPPPGCGCSRSHRSPRGLADRFRLLTGGPRTATPRLKTLRASVDWSHELLSDQERALLRRLAVFAGGFTLEAVEEVCAGEGMERERRARPARLAGRPVAGDRRGARLGGPLPPAGDRAPIRARAAWQRPEKQKPYAPATAITTSPSPNRPAPTWRPAASSSGSSSLDPEAANLAAAIDHALRSEPAVRAALLRGALSLVVRARSLRRGRAGALALAGRLRGRASPRCAHARSKVAPTSPSGWASSKRRRRTRPRRWRSRRRSATRGPRRGRAAISGSAMRSRTPAPGERSSRARPSSPGRRATTGRSWRPSSRRPSPTCTKVNTRRPPAPTRRWPRWPSGWATPSRSPGAGSGSLCRLSSTVASPRRARRSSGCERRWRPPASRSWRHLRTPSRGSSMSGRASPSARSSACRRGSNAP